MDIRSLPHFTDMRGKRPTPANPAIREHTDDVAVYIGPGELVSYTRPDADSDVFCITVGINRIPGLKGSVFACYRTGLWHSLDPGKLVDPTPDYPAGLMALTVHHYLDQCRKAAPTYR